MARKPPKRLRSQLAAEAARIMAESGFLDFDGVRRKVASRYRVNDRRLLPDNDEIREALSRYQDLFQPGQRDARLRQLRALALEAMRLLEGFDPRLVGHVRDGMAGDHSRIHLQVTADNPKSVAMEMLNRRIPYTSEERRVRFADSDQGARPAFLFTLDGVEVEALVLGFADRSHPPVDPASGRPERGLTPAEVAALVTRKSHQPASGWRVTD
ncbi:MAG: hypothetical protein ABFS23_10115 [Pseudomonadota bacterium]